MRAEGELKKGYGESHVRLAVPAPPKVADPASAGLELLGQGLARAFGFSPRQRDVCLFYARGLIEREIAEALGIHEKTAANHLQLVCLKLGCRERRQVHDRVLEFAIARLRNE